MAHSGSNPAESLVEPLEESFAFSDDAVASLQKVLPDLVFLESEKVLDQFRCKSCRRIALRPHVTNCRHLLCGPCFEESSRKNCPVAGCPNTTILDEGKKKTETQHGLLKLRVRCLHYEYGCEEVFPLQFLLDHKPICKFRKENLLPKMWTPNVLKDHHYIEQLQRDLNHLREAFNVLKAEVILIKKELLQKTEQLLQVQHNEKGFVSDITLIQEQLVILENLQGTDIKKLIKDAIVEQLNPLKEVLKKDVHDYLKIVTDQHRVDIITEISSGLTRQLVKDEALLENNLFDKVKSENIEMLTKHIKELEEKIQMQSEEISTSLKNACSKELQNKTDDLWKVVGQQETIEQETNLKIEECLRALDHFKTQTEDSLNRKVESKELERTVLYSYLGPSCRARWVEWALEEKRTEFVWKVPGVGSLVQRWKREGKGHLQSEVFVTKEFGFKIRVMLECSYLYGIDWSIEFVKEEATPTRPSIYNHRRTFVVMDQSEGNGPKRDIVRIQEPHFGNEEAQRWMKGFHGIDWCFIPIKYFESGAPYVVNDALCLRILIEPLSVLWKSFASNDGTILWRIDDYSKKKKDSIEGVIYYLYSDSFYSNPRGFRMKIGLTFHSNGDLRMWVLFLRGEWDESLSERFPHKTTLTILDQSDSKRKKHLIRTEESDSTGGYWMGPNLPRSELERGPYLKDDSLLVKVVVEPKG